MKKKLMVNLGSGANLLDGFINVDIVVPPNATKDNFKQGSALDLPFNRDSVDYILMDNVLEHIPMKDQPQALFEIKRVLKPSGRCVIIVPDFTYLAKKWLEIQQVGFDIFPYRWLAEEIYGNQAHPGEFHTAPMTPAYMHWLMTITGLNSGIMTMYEANAQGPTSDNYPGVNPQKLKTFVRNDMICVDIVKKS